MCGWLWELGMAKEQEQGEAQLQSAGRKSTRKSSFLNIYLEIVKTPETIMYQYNSDIETIISIIFE